MKYFLLFFSVICFAQNPADFRADLAKIQKQHLENNFERNINYINKIIDEKKYTDEREIFYLESYKVSALVQAQEYEEAINLSDLLLKNGNKPPEMVLKLRIQRSLVYEILMLLTRSESELQQAELFLKKYPGFRSKYYGEFLVRSASLNRIKGNAPLFLKFAERAKIFADSANDFERSAEASILLAFYHRDVNFNSQDLLNSYSESLKIAKKNHLNGLVIALYLNISNKLFKDKNFHDAQTYADSADVLINKKGDFQSHASVYEIKSKIFSAQNKFDSALSNYQKFHEATLKLNEAGQKIKITELERRRTLQKELEEKEDIEKSLDATKKINNQLIFLISTLGLFSLALIFATYLLDVRRKKISQQRENIKVKNDSLNQLVKQKEFLVQELNHRVKNNLAAILTLIQLQTDETESEEQKSDFRKLYSRIHTISIGHHLYNYSPNHMDTAFINVKVYTDKILENKKASSGKMLEFTNDSEEIMSVIDTTLPLGLMLNELISNSEKHAVLPDSEHLKIYLSITKKDQNMKIIYSDNGTYFNPNKSSESLGMYIISGMIDQLRGTFERTDSKYIIYVPL